MSDPRNLLGCCVLCDKEVFEIFQRARRDAAIGRIPLKIGRPHPEARRVTLVLANGRRMDVSLCGDCEATPQTLPELWRIVRRGLAIEGRNEYRDAYTREAGRGRIHRLKLYQQWLTGAWQLGQVYNVPLGVLYEQPWTEVPP